jgi:hypothetical protein
VLRGDVAATSPSCASCGRVTCSACEWAGLCAGCVEDLWTPPDALELDERVPIVVGGSSLPGRRPPLVSQLRAGGADEATR